MSPHDKNVYPEGRGPGTWHWIKGGVMFTCPSCAAQGVLDHTVGADGRVYPSVECPTPGCGFHEHVVLEGWRGAA